MDTFGFNAQEWLLVSGILSACCMGVVILVVSAIVFLRAEKKE